VCVRQVTRCKDQRKLAEGNAHKAVVLDAFRIVFDVEALANASDGGDSQCAELVLAFRDAAKYAHWQQLLAAQAFQPPSWLGPDELGNFTNVQASPR
jgi:hypothetical protein